MKRISVSSDGHHPIEIHQHVSNTPAYKQLALAGNMEVLDMPFPGEPQDVAPAVRADLWRMRLLGDTSLMYSVERKAYLIRELLQPLSMGTGMLIFSLLSYSIMNLVGLTGEGWGFLGVVLGSIAGGFVAQKLHVGSLEEKVLNMRLLLSDIQKEAWPQRLSRVLDQCLDSGFLLSHELVAFNRLLHTKDVQLWANLFVEDTAALSVLCERLTSLHETIDVQADSMHVQLSGEESELVYRVSNIVNPRLDATLPLIA